MQRVPSVFTPKNHINRTVPFFPIVSSIRLHGIMTLPSSSRASVSKQSKEGSPLGVSLLTAEKASERFLRIRGIIFLIDVDALFLRQCLCCLLPNVGAFIRSDIYLASFRNVECLIEVRHRAKSASGAGFVWRMHVFFDL